MHSPSRFVGILLAILGAVSFLVGVGVIHVADFSDIHQQYFGVTGGLILTLSAAILSLRYPIDIWWYKRYPPVLEPKLVILLERLFPFYTRLDIEEKKRFVKELTIFLLKTEVELINAESLPSDVETFVAATAVQLDFYKKNEVFKYLEKVIFYPVPFPTLANRQTHTAEFHEDGVVILALRNFTEGLVKPQLNFNIGLYTFACAFLHYEDLSFSQLSDVDLKALEEIRGLTAESVQKSHNIHNFNMDAFVMEVYFYDDKLLEKSLPLLYEKLKSTFVDFDQ